MVCYRVAALVVVHLVLTGCSSPEVGGTTDTRTQSDSSFSDPTADAGIASTNSANTSLEATAIQPGDPEIIACARIQPSAERLGCYDELAVARGYEPPQDVVQSTGKWLVNETTNPIDDTRTVTLILTAEPGSSSTRMGELPVLVARCQSNTTELYINWGQYIGDDSSSVYDEWKYVTVRVGSDDAQQQRWGVSTSRESTFAPNWAGSLLQRMATNNTFVARTTPYGENPMTAIFDTSGLSDALVPLMDECGWSLDGQSSE